MIANKTGANELKRPLGRLRRDTTSMIVAAGEPIELACHAFGAPLKFIAGKSWQVGGRNEMVDPNDSLELPSNDRFAHTDALGLDQISLVFWYKDQNPSPIYTLDARHFDRSAQNKHPLAHAKHYQSDTKYKLDLASQFPLIKLLILSGSAEDSGDYKCRVDLRQSATINRVIRLLVQGKHLHTQIVQDVSQY